MWVKHTRYVTLLTVLLTVELIYPFSSADVESNTQIPDWCLKLKQISQETTDWCTKKSGVRVNTTDRLRMLRNRIKYYDYGAYIITSSDEHQSEYPSEYDKRREYVTGFSGSVGTAVVLVEDIAALWVDGRYHLQAANELDCNWKLMKQADPDTPTLIKWLVRNLKEGDNKRIAADPKFVSQQEWSDWQKELSEGGLSLETSSSNLVDDIWPAKSRPPEPTSKAMIHPPKFSGTYWEDKVKSVRSELAASNLDALIITDLSEIAWLLNLRGADIPFVPVFKAFIFLTYKEIRLYIKKTKITPSIERQLNVNGCANHSCIRVQIRHYEEFFTQIKDVVKSDGLKVIMSESASYAVYKSVPKELVTLAETPTRRMMVIKNAVEAKGLKEAHFRDCVVLAEFFSMLEKDVERGQAWDEMSAARTIDQMRGEAEWNQGPSFETIAAFGANAALPHYSPNAWSNLTIDDTSLFLLDSGGQYFDGTTDITRTVHFGQPTEFQKEAYTRVLQGVIALASIVFPNGTTDSFVDFVTRQYLYQKGLDYSHGTGHGVGSYLNVHEYPPLIGSKPPGRKLLPGMFFSIEPGYYEEGQFGIRLESIFTVVEAQTEHRHLNKSFFKFVPVSFLPFEPKLIQYSSLTKAQVKWLNDYNAKIINTVGVKLRRDSKYTAYEWLMARTGHITGVCGTVSLASSYAITIAGLLTCISTSN